LKREGTHAIATAARQALLEMPGIAEGRDHQKKRNINSPVHVSELWSSMARGGQDPIGEHG